MIIMRALFLFLCSAVFLAVIGVIGGAIYAVQLFQSPLPISESFEYEIPRGQSIRGVATDLTERDILRSPYIFDIGTKMMGMTDPIHAGEYEIKAGMSAQEMLQMFQDGATIQRLVTVREGLTSYEIVQDLRALPLLSGEITDIPAEGSLLPETYSYHKNEARSTIIARMQKAMTDILDQVWESRAEGLPIESKDEAVILASIIEKETGVADERRRVAGVFINRLHAGMPLQTDPTVIYGITGGEHEDKGLGPLGRRLLRKDLAHESPYNTYLHAGLPPGPIANPGKASIEAALNPEEHDYYYFVADGTGGHVFSKNLEEHNRNAAKWRKIRKSQ
jgi:UPF0755 protein